MLMLELARGKAFGLGLLCLLSSGASSGVRSPQAEHARARVITIQEFQFRPATDTLRVGDSVTWKNHDIVPHTATSDARGFDSKTIEAEGTWRFVAKKQGRLSYHCRFHPAMKGVIVVQ